MIKSDDHLFHSYDLDRESTITNTRFLFNNAEHLRLQHTKHWRIYEMLDQKTHAIKARIAFYIDEHKAVSPLRAPFGFIEMFHKTGTQELVNFFSLLELDLKKRGVKKIQLKSYPEVYDKNFSVVEVALKRLHYSLGHEVSSVIPVDGKPFEKKIKISERQKLRKAEQLFLFEKGNINQIKEVYTFIESCRKEKDQTLSMSFADLKKTITTFPKHFFLYRVYDESGTAAAAIVIKINKEILYTFYYAHAQRFDKVSPVVFLISSIYESAQHHGVEMIDLGTSMINGKINRSLLHFKKSIGGVSCRKLSFDKVLV